MKKAIAYLAAAVLLSSTAMLAAQKRRPAWKTGTHYGKTVSKKASSKKAVFKKAGARKGHLASSRKKGQTWRSRQLQPTPERYRQIQQALINRGYLQEPASGTWNQTSIEALRRFQQDQNLETTGKIDSLSLIALGLGPKHESASAAPGTHPPQP